MNKPNMTWVPSPNHSLASKKLKTLAIVNHIMSGTLSGTDSWFANPASQVSSHFGVGKNGEIHQYVSLDNPAWANGGVNKPDWPLLSAGINPNYYTVSIEHEGQSGDVMPEAQYQATLALHRWLIETLGIPVTRDTIIGHYRIDSVNKSNCPGLGFPWDRLFKDLEGGGNQVDEGILIFGDDDYVPARRLNAALGNTAAIFIRLNGKPPAVIKSAKHLYVVGGDQQGVDHPNQTVLAGPNWFATVEAVGKKLGY